MTGRIGPYLKAMLAPFNRGHASFVGSSAVVMLFPMISAPIVARLYTPSDFGIYAVFFALATILSAISTLELRNIALLEADRGDAAHGALLAISVTALFSAGLFALWLALPTAWIAGILGTAVVPHLVWLPLSVFLMGGSQVLYTWATREKAYPMLARNKLILGLATMIFQIGIGLMRPGPFGFIIANLAGLILASALLGAHFGRSLRQLGPNFTAASAVAQFRRHSKLALWTMPGSLLNAVSQTLPDLLINRFFGPALLGQYSLAMRMVNLPIAFLGTSIQDFFRQQASEEFNLHGHCRSSFRRFFALTLLGAVFLLLPVMLLVPFVFPILFGAQWTEAGGLVQAVAILVMTRFISSPLSYVWLIRGKQKLDFLWQTGFLAISFGGLLLPPFMMPEITLHATLWIYGLAAAAWYLLAIVVSHNLSGKPGGPVPPAVN